MRHLFHGHPNRAADPTPNGEPLPMTLTCPICGGTMLLLRNGKLEWFYECDSCGTVAFP